MTTYLYLSMPVYYTTMWLKIKAAQTIFFCYNKITMLCKKTVGRWKKAALGKE